MAHTYTYPLHMQAIKSANACARGALRWVKRHPRASLPLILLLIAAAAAVDLMVSRGAGPDVLYFLPVVLAGIAFDPPGALLITAICVGLHFTAGSVTAVPLAQGAPWMSQVSLPVALFFVAALSGCLRRSFVREGQQNRILDGLGVVSTAITSSLDLQQVLETTLDQARRLTGADPLGIWLLDRERGELVLEASLARSPSRRVRADAARVSLESEHIVARSVARAAILVADAHQKRTGTEGLPLCVSGVSTVAAVPLVARNVTVGALAAGFGTAPDREMLQILREIANGAAVAIDNAQLYANARRHVSTLDAMREDAERSERQAKFLAEAGRIFSASLDVRVTMETVVAKATEVLGDVCLIGVVDEGAETLRITASYENGTAIGRSLREYLVAHPARVGQGVLGRTARTGTPCVVRGDASIPGELGEYASALGVRGMIVVPLRSRGRVIGVLASAYYDLELLPTEDDLQFALLLADRAAMAIDNAALFEEAQQARVTLEAWSHELERRVDQKTRELSNAQRELLRAERLASIGQLAATVAHELRNPLNIIKVAHFALAKNDGGERSRRHLDAIDRQVSAASRIIDTLLDFARDAPLQVGVVDLNRLAQQVLADTALPEHLEVVVDVAPDLPPVRADRVQIAQVLSNLIDNAVQMMPVEGTLYIRTSRDGSRACVSVRDTGPGIPEAVRPRIFEPLFTTKTKGTGLGLAIAHRIMEAHGGEIHVESVPHAGATFTLALPIPQDG